MLQTQAAIGLSLDKFWGDFRSKAPVWWGNVGELLGNGVKNFL